MADQYAQYLVELHQLLMTHYDVDELQSLCFRLGVVYADVPGNTRRRKGEELLLVLARQGRLSELLGVLQEERPLIEWPSVPQNFEPPAGTTFPDSSLPSAPAVNIGRAGIVNVGGIQNFNASLSFGETAVSQTSESNQASTDESLTNVWRKIENDVVKLPVGSAPQKEAIWTHIRQFGKNTMMLAQSSPDDADTLTNRIQKLLQSLAENPLDPDMVEIRGKSLQKAADKAKVANPIFPQLSQQIVQQCLFLAHS